MQRVWCLTMVLVAAYPAVGDRSVRETPVVKAFRQVKDSVVNISTTRIVERRSGWFSDEVFDFFDMPSPFARRRLTHSLGSGFVIHPSGYIVTNAHVVERATQVEVTFADKTTLKAVKAYPYPEHDLVVLKLEPGKPLKSLPLGRGDDLLIGETVVAIGNPLGYQHTVTTGVVSAVGRKLEFRGGMVYKELIQTDASINPGNSGGPLLNINGELIGVNTAIRGDAQNIGFAINVEVLKRVLPQLFDVEAIRRINLGFTVAATSDNRRVQVVSVVAGSPADKAGIAAGDGVIEYADTPIVDPVGFYVKLLEHPTGQRLVLTVARNGKRQRMTMPFEVRPKPDARKLALRRLGVELRQLPIRQSRRLGFDSSLVAVGMVVRDGPGAQVGLERGDIITRLGQRRIHTLDDVGETLEPVRAGDTIRVGIIRVLGRTLYGSDVTMKVR